ncbi:hypothetical protein WDJ51_06955 [Rathayibacter sp. YIM 133350]|uniref:hypothetical protein n=1 Tax=Rathayibacter sp. YIM 133350 TaxID=3131992 RepID=UPI00307EA9AF
MDRHRLWVIAYIVIAVAVVAGGWFLGVQPQLAAAGGAIVQRADIDASNATQEKLIVQLQKDKDGIDALKADLATLSQSVPLGTGAPDFVNQLHALAQSSNVTLSAFSVAEPTAYAPAVPDPAAATAAAAASPGATPSPTPTPTPAATPAPTPAAPTPGMPPATNSLITASNFATMQVDISVKGDYANVMNFVSGLQTGSRLFLVTSLSTKKSDGESVDGTISGFIYALVPPAAPAAPAAADAAVAAK